MTDDAKLREPLPCPFCGQPPVVESGDGWGDVACANVKGCPVRVSVFGKSLEEAIVRWNTRAAVPRIAEQERERDAPLVEREGDK